MGDFDFFVGTWNVVNRRLRKRLVGSDEWEEFPGMSVAHGFFGGGGHFDEIVFPTKGFAGATIRLFDPATEQWSIYWMNSGRGELEQPPMVGRFVDGVGRLYADDQHEGRPVRCRFIWSEITATSARWEQAFSVDGERTWETNWIMTFTKAAE
ncbi:hypothetical protein GA0070607_6131 [Micromonospora coriariae]|uniref:DUF1579 domain-containing protein n=1 Tax=Micromonospora coriariae TaxID=285665 RepID=A0A1C4Y271_9ACTN|nr:hypothetical protein [Micromonospora coriariae]SCF14814.1 hypothetical protein GA0070607_6131 [Micromonospora coriariae]